MSNRTTSYIIGLVVAGALLMPAAGIAAKPDQEVKPGKEITSGDRKDGELNKVEQKKSLHAERKAAAKRFKQAQESVKTKGANKK